MAERAQAPHREAVVITLFFSWLSHSDATCSAIVRRNAKMIVGVRQLRRPASPLP